MATSERSAGVQTNPLFVGATRPAMIFGVTYEAIVAIAMFVGVTYIMTAKPLWLLSVIPLYAICYGISRKDPRAFRLMFLGISSKGRCFNRPIWKCASYSPLPFRKRK